MIDRPDLRSEDLANRVALRDLLRQVRVDTHGSLRGLRNASREAGLGARFVEDCEDTAQWGVRRVQTWARFLGHRFRMDITGLTVPDDGDITAAVLADVVTFGWADEDQVHIRQVVNNLARIRRHQQISYGRLSRIVGCGDRAIQGWEDQPERCHVKTVQRYARGLGGALALDVVPMPAVVPV